MAKQATLVIFKPDAIRRALVGAALSKLETLGLEVIGAKPVRVTRAMAEEHYKHIKAKPFYEETVQHLQGTLHSVDAVIAFVFWGENAVERVRQVTGATNPEKAEPTTIRGALGRNLSGGLMENVIHASSDAAEARREIELWFKPGELLVNPYAEAPRDGRGVAARP
jgi:nucleoside-diphosphate kinase